MGEAVEARARLREALQEVRVSADRTHEAVVLVYLARAEMALGDLEASRELLEEALILTEALRGSIPGAGERASFMAATRDRYELLIDVLMQLHAREPERGWDAEAFHVSERARARSLVELLAEARIDLREGIDESLLAKEKSSRSSSKRGAGTRRGEWRISAPLLPDRTLLSTLSSRNTGTRKRACAPRARGSRPSLAPSPFG